jgi:hypothetical protein
MLTNGDVLHHDSFQNHTAAVTVEMIQILKFKLLSHPAYRPDLTPYEYHIFGLLKDTNLQMMKRSRTHCIYGFKCDWKHSSQMASGSLWTTVNERRPSSLRKSDLKLVPTIPNTPHPPHNGHFHGQPTPPSTLLLIHTLTWPILTASWSCIGCYQ